MVHTHYLRVLFLFDVKTTNKIKVAVDMKVNDLRQHLYHHNMPENFDKCNIEKSYLRCFKCLELKSADKFSHQRWFLLNENQICKQCLTTHFWFNDGL